MLCDSLEGWNGMGREAPKGGYIYTNIIITDMHCKAETKTTL